MAGQGRTLILGRFFSVRHFSAMLPLLLEICFPCLLRLKPGADLNDGRFFDRYPPLSTKFQGRHLLVWSDLAGRKKPPKIGMFHEKAGVVL
jgi:hypothetical protein